MSDNVSAMTAQAEAVVRRHAARNFWLNVLDGGTFYLGLSMVSRFTVLPLFVERLSPDRWLQGLIPAINYTGWFLPGLFIVPLIAAMPRRKPILLTATLFERLPFLILGLVLLFRSDLPSAGLLAIFFGCYAMHAVAAGFASIPWQDFIARVIPGKRWGIFFGLQSGLGGLLDHPRTSSAESAAHADPKSAIPIPDRRSSFSLHSLLRLADTVNTTE